MKNRNEIIRPCIVKVVWNLNIEIRYIKSVDAWEYTITEILDRGNGMRVLEKNTDASKHEAIESVKISVGNLLGEE